MYGRWGKRGSELDEEEEEHSHPEETGKRDMIDLCMEGNQEEEGEALGCRGNGGPGDHGSMPMRTGDDQEDHLACIDQ